MCLLLLWDLGGVDETSVCKESVYVVCRMAGGRTMGVGGTGNE